MKQSVGIALKIGRSDITGNWFSKEVLSTALANYKNSNRQFGELGHPDRVNVDLNQISHKVTKSELTDKGILVEITTMPTIEGQTLEKLIERGAVTRISPRMLGRIDPKTQEVTDLEIIAFDVMPEYPLPLVEPSKEFQNFIYGTVLGLVLVILMSYWVDYAILQ